MNNNQQLKKYLRRQIEALTFLYAWSLLDWCHIQNKILSQYISRYWWESMNMLKQLQEDLTDDYNTNLYLLYKRIDQTNGLHFSKIINLYIIVFIRVWCYIKKIKKISYNF